MLPARTLFFCRARRGSGEQGHDRSLIETCKLNAVDPLAYLTATLTAIVRCSVSSR
ncbi:transposase domain-containing protein (plasmid) [Rhizobium sp. SU303]|uniref:transposase domain-containing protein n=1 Tax=Rhizobium sp. SU303 TaxID=3138065 RepID=UPI001E448C0F|nr:transposase domain-containing protein [Rhizobium leguminosarum]UFW80966.1 transposase domain-containing protein [Rhizobium leguminosarum bv. viciae]